jgi:hypothetical protein
VQCGYVNYACRDFNTSPAGEDEGSVVNVVDVEQAELLPSFERGRFVSNQLSTVNLFQTDSSALYFLMEF